MSSNITFNGVTYAIPDDGDFNWGPDLTAYFIAIASGALQKTGGTFTLGAETDFGASYGLKSLYYKSRHANPAAAGQFRLGNTESISWRNNANSADLALTSNASDALLFNSKNVLFSALGLIVDADVNAAAAIAYSKLAALTASRLLVSSAGGVISVSAVTATEAGYLAGVTSAIQTQLNLLAPKASPTFSGTITTPLTASRLMVTGASSELAILAVTATEAAYLAGVTSAIQTQLDAKQLRSTLTAKGDLYVATASNTVARQAVGANGSQLMADSGQTNGMRYIFGQGDVQAKTTTYSAVATDGYINASGSAFTITLFAASGNAGKILTITKTDATLANIITIDGNASETINGALTTTLNTQYESVTLYCDGTNWFILFRRIPSEWISWTPTGNWTTNTTYVGRKRRVGDSMEYDVRVSTAGAPGGTAQFLVNILETIDTAKITSTDSTQIMGSYRANDSGGAQYNGTVRYSTTTAVACALMGAAGTYVDDPALASATVPFTFGAGDYVTIRFTAPISGWNG